MEDHKRGYKEDITQFIKEANEKSDKLTDILEKFGFDIITKMGQTNMKINTLTDKINELNKATIDIKSLTPQLTNIIENQKILEAELDLIRSLVQKSNVSFRPKAIVEDEVERDTSATVKKQSIIGQFNELKNIVDELDDPGPVVERLENIKEDIFIFKGGHRILYEIAQLVKKLEENKTLPDDKRNPLKKKLYFGLINFNHLEFAF